MKHPTMRSLIAATSVGVVMLLAACGGGSGGGYSGFLPAAGGTDTTPTADTVPSSALASADAFIAYMKTLIANRTNDTAPPVALGNAVLPVDESREASGL